MPEKLRFLLKKASNGRKVIQESYVAGVDRKTGRGRKNLSGGMPADSTGMLPPDGRTLQYRLKAAGKEAGVPWITFQVLRDTFVVMCLQAGGDIYSIAYVLGINVAAVCDRYEAWFVKKESFLSGIG